MVSTTLILSMFYFNMGDILKKSFKSALQKSSSKIR